MRLAGLGLLCAVFLALLLAPSRVARADEEPPGAPPSPEKPAEELTEAEREAALERAGALNARIEALYEQGKYSEAIPLAREVLSLREKAQGPEHPDAARSLNNLALLLQKMGQYEQARPLFERALSIIRKALGPEHPDVATCLDNLADLLRVMGHYEAALPLCERSFQIREKVLGPEHPDVATSLKGLAGLLHAMGQYEAARPLLERALEIRERALGPEHPHVAASLNNLAFLFVFLGRYEAARPLYERALLISEKALGPEHPNVATELNNLGMLLQTLGLYEAARPLFERALRIREKVLGPEHPQLAGSLNNLAMLLYSTGHYEAARPLFERALEIRQKAQGPQHPLVAQSLNNLAGLLRAIGQYEQARPLLEHALEINEQALGSEHPEVAGSLNSLASLLEALGQREAARPLFEHALRIYEKALGPEHPDVAQSLNNLAVLLMEMGQYDRATPLLARCLDIVERNLRRSFMGLQASERAALTRILRPYLDHWLRLIVHLARSGHAEVLRFKGLVARATAAERRLSRLAGQDSKKRVESLRAADRRLSRLVNSMPPMFEKERHAAWKEAYAKAAAEREALALALARDFAPLREGLERLDIDREDVQARLGPDEVLVDFLQAEDRYLAWLVRSEGEPERVDLGHAQAIAAAAAAFTALAADSDTTTDLPEWQEASRELRDLVFAQLEAGLGEGVRTLYLCPDAALAAVPFACLPGREPGRFLIDDHLLVQVSMAQDLVPWKNEGPTGNGAVALGDVDYLAAEAAAEHPLASSPSGIAALDRAPRGRDFGPLPETKDEVEFVQKLLGEECVALLGADATEARLRAEVKGKRILHLATHGFVRDDLLRGLRRREDDTRWLGAAMERQLAAGYDPMLLAGLAFAGANPRDGAHGDDGILTAAEASYLDLDGVDLVVLSACETALGRAESGEGVIGLVRGFQMAGAKRVIASLWQVDDEATRLLMEHLYAGMLREEGPLSPAAALREAALKVRGATAEGGRSFAAPRYWASFVCYGR